MTFQKSLSVYYIFFSFFFEKEKKTIFGEHL